MKASVKLTIIILDFLKAQRVLENVEKLQKQEVDFDFQIILIDNSCNKENACCLKKLLKYENVNLKINKENNGYTRAHNMCKKEIQGDYVLILNPDILCKHEDTLQKMVSFMDLHKKVGAMGPKQINDDGSLAMTVRAFPKFHLQVSRRTFLRNLPYLHKKVEYDEMKHLNYSRAQAVDWLQSSCVIVRKKLWDELGGLDEDYFLFMSDVELCFQAWKKEYEVIYLPQIQVHADGKRCSSGGFLSFFKSNVLRLHVKDALKYQANHAGEKNPREKYCEKNIPSVEDLHFFTPMKGIVLAGGGGTRLHPLTKVTSKQLLPIFSKPMIYYPIETLINSGIKEILIIVAPENAGDFLKLLGSGKEFGVRFTYEIQDKPDGIAQAFKIAENFIGKDNVTLILGDNIFENDFSDDIQSFESGAKIFVKEVHDPERFGVVEFNASGDVISLEEKPKKPKSHFAQTGIYVCDNSVIKKTKKLKPSKRGELEITDVMKVYLKEKSIKASKIKGKWFDTGTFESMFEASCYIRERELGK